MGRFILCTGRTAVKPYIFPISETRVYSIEELCHYIYNNIYEISVEIFDKVMTDWIRKEARLPVVADKIETMIEGYSSLKDIVVTILCGCDYYSEQEIKALIVIMSEIENLPHYGRKKKKADTCLKYGKYFPAKKEYDSILKNADISKLPPEEYGNILHNRSIACFYMGEYREVGIGFKAAYSYNGNAQSLRHYLLSLLINNDHSEFDKEAEAYELSDMYINNLKNELSEAYIQAESAPYYKEMEKFRRYSSGKEAELYADRMINEWKQRIRSGNV